MAHNDSLAETLEYSRTLLEAGMTGLRNAQSNNSSFNPDIASAARGALKIAAIGAGVALLRPNLSEHRNRRMRTAMCCAVLGFCAGFAWRTRRLTGTIVDSASKEISKARDQHWLQLNPVDYA